MRDEKKEKTKEGKTKRMRDEWKEGENKGRKEEENER